jgi:NDP-sugar pyrophosphorylase family protein
MLNAAPIHGSAASAYPGSPEVTGVKRAVVLAGGEGTRLLPYTAVIPKPLMPVGDRPVLDIVMRQLAACGFTHVTVATGYLAELIEAFFRDGEAYGLTIDYFREREPLGTVGALALIEDLDEPFLVMNGDVLTDLSYQALADAHIASGAAATIATTEREIQVSLGVMRFEDAAQPDAVTGYIEKPRMRYDVSMGVYIFDPRVRAHLVPGARLDFPDLVLRLIEAGESVRAWRPDAYWLDIGRHDDYEAAMREFEAMRPRLLPSD